MEDDDFTIDDEGKLSLQYGGWTEVDTRTFESVDKIITLDLSFNQLQSLPDEIGLLKKMTHFNCACNALESIPSSIGRLRRMQEFKVNGNRLTKLPDEIGSCHRLSTIYLNENRLESLPSSMGECARLTLIQLENNQLQSIPLTLAKLKDTLESITLTNNPRVSIIPMKMHGNSRVVMWIVCFLHEKTTLVDTIRAATLEMSLRAKRNEQIIEESNRQISNLEQERRTLLAERESVKNFLIVREWWRRGRIQIRKMKSFYKKMMIRDNRIAISELNGDDL